MRKISGYCLSSMVNYGYLRSVFFLIYILTQTKAFISFDYFECLASNVNSLCYILLDLQDSWSQTFTHTVKKDTFHFLSHCMKSNQTKPLLFQVSQDYQNYFILLNTAIMRERISQGIVYYFVRGQKFTYTESL